MLCRNPIGLENIYVPCGRCLPCRVQKRRLWATRMELESLAHEHTSMITLTYSDENLPAEKTLDPVHLRNWLKRIRKRVAPLPLRFFSCGEYGGISERPHYHAILFGYQSCLRGGASGLRVYRPSDCCSQCAVVSETWGYGLISCECVTPASFRYVAGYVTKKMMNKDDPRLRGRYPEFARMSLKPGIGVPAIPLIAKALEDGFRIYDKGEDVPSYLIVRGKKMPIGKYLQRELRLAIGRSKDTPEHVKRAFLQKMQTLWEASKDLDTTPKELLLKLGEAQAANMEFYETMKPKREKI